MKIETRDATVHMAGRVALDPISVELTAGDSLALVGPSGSGKTTLLNVLSLLQRVSDGRVLIDGRDACGWSDDRRRLFWRRHAALVFQDHGVIDEESVGVNVALSLSSARTVRGQLRHRVEEVLDRVDLAGRIDDRGSTLSGGEKQRVGFARAILKSADVIFADEPTASLDADNRALVTDLLLGEARRGAAVVVATHDLDIATACSRSVRLRA